MSHSGNNIVFVYPDMKTVLVGNFSGNIMQSARASKVGTSVDPEWLPEALVQTLMHMKS